MRETETERESVYKNYKLPQWNEVYLQYFTQMFISASALFILITYKQAQLLKLYIALLKMRIHRITNI